MAKELITKSIQIIGIVNPNAQTVFNIENESEKRQPTYRSLTLISGRILSLLFEVSEDGEISKHRLPLQIIVSNSEDDIKTFILAEIDKYISNL